MNDALLVRGFERIGGLLRNRDRFIERDRAAGDSIGQRGPLDQLQDERAGGEADGSLLRKSSKP